MRLCTPPFEGLWKFPGLIMEIYWTDNGNLWTSKWKFLERDERLGRKFIGNDVSTSEAGRGNKAGEHLVA